jgi:hypothetical protein
MPKTTGKGVQQGKKKAVKNKGKATKTHSCSNKN